MRSLVRGDVSVVDLASGRLVAQGEGIQTWSEVGLGEVRQVLVETPQSGAEPSRSCRWWSVRCARPRSRLDATEEARVSSPQGLSTAAVDGLAVTEALPEMAPEPDRWRCPRPEDEAHWAIRGRRADSAPADRVWTSPTPEPLEDDGDPSRDARSSTHDARCRPASTPRSAGRAGERRHPADAARRRPARSDDQPIQPAGRAVPGLPDHGGGLPVRPPSPQNATSCRICGSPIAPQGPQLVPRPGARGAAGLRRHHRGRSTAPCWSGGRPSGQRSSARAPRLMTVPSPGHDISRTHLEVAAGRMAGRRDRPALHQRHGPGPSRRGRPAAADSRASRCSCSWAVWWSLGMESRY